ncbi:RNA polymerase sigma factor (sigma-70 family) [Kibdelosporangium banguiense]|uniref:RNA polymerase sigma factor (Sigma-70 family) n=1 Tax=Kibdelosporangium banguiense TaxID=1365924 RepID=A0ABS4TU69_9PSEU|nr:sigma-70 family RNA polymerase sigma factor [Kibdelosporangium banguiense]MBP2327964.1 RNA polymerase sigma factor (sigma-70 family) [Kibdelosporangium banguiense]
MERWQTSGSVAMRAELDRALGRDAPDEPLSRADSANSPVASDADLIEAVRGGAVQAYGQLYARHVHAANNLARQLSRSPMEADDLVSEAFAKVLTTLRAGGGPDTAFRAYLLTALRHTAYDKTRRDRKLELVDDMEAVSGAERINRLPFHDTTVAHLDRSLAVKAFASLPERWQTVLWHTAIEGQSPNEVAPLLGLTSNGVSAMAYRAREGLRKAYLQAHVVHHPSERCRAAAAKLGSWTRSGLSRRETTQVEAHLDKCADCRALAAELADVNGTLRGVVAPLVLGAGAAGYLAASAGKAGATVSLAASTSTTVLPWLGAAASTAAVVFAVASGTTPPNSAIGPTSVVDPPASSTNGQTTAPTGQSGSPAATPTGTAPPSGTGAPTGPSLGPSVGPSVGGPSAAPPGGTTNPTSAGNGAPTLTPTAPGSFTTSTGGPPTRVPITIRNTGSAPAPPTTLTLSLPDDIKLVGPGNNLLSGPLLRLNAAQQTIGCPAGKDTVVCPASPQLAPGDSVTFVFRLLAGPKATGGTITATTNSAVPLRIEIPVTITPKK